MLSTPLEGPRLSPWGQEPGWPLGFPPGSPPPLSCLRSWDPLQKSCIPRPLPRTACISCASSPWIYGLFFLGRNTLLFLPNTSYSVFVQSPVPATTTKPPLSLSTLRTCIVWLWMKASPNPKLWLFLNMALPKRGNNSSLPFTGFTTGGLRTSLLLAK